MTTLVIILNKIVTFLINILKIILHKDGSVWPGYIASKCDPDILNKLVYPKFVIGVTGSSGKGSTTKLIAKILTKNGYKVVWNKNGSNITNALTTLILNHTNPFTKKVKCDVLLLELDESSFYKVFNKNQMTHLIVTNLTRDQVARNGEPILVYNRVKDSLSDNIHLILNADDPLVLRYTIDTNNTYTKYGIQRYETDYTKPYNDTLDSTYCPRCNKKLKYHFYHYGNIGSFYCKECEFGTNPLDYKGKDINLTNRFMTINDHIVKLDHGAFFTAYATLAAYTTCNLIGISDEDIMKVLNNDYKDSNSENMFRVGRRKIEMIDSKPENALSYEQTIDYINEQKGTKTVVIGFDNVSRRYALNDLSWMYDIDFNKLNKKDIDKIYCIGRFRYDIAVCLKYNNIPDNKVVIVDDYKRVLPNKVYNHSKGNIYVVVFLDMMAPVKKALSEVRR